MGITRKSAEVMFFLAQVTPPIKGISRVRKINKAKFWIQCHTWWSVYALNQTFYSSLYSAAVNLTMSMYSACTDKSAWESTDVNKYLECTKEITRSNSLIQKNINHIELFSINM